MSMKRISGLMLGLALLGFAHNAAAFKCRTSTISIDAPLGGGGNYSVNVGVTLNPVIGINENLVVDLSNQISCEDNGWNGGYDATSVQVGSQYAGSISQFTGTLQFYSNSYAWPLQGETTFFPTGPAGIFMPWQAKLYLTPIGAASGVIIKSGEVFASVKLHKVYLNSGTGSNSDDYFTWNIYSLNDVVVPTGGCDVSSRNVIVNLPDYPGSSTSIPLTVICPSGTKNLSYYLTGTTANSSSGNNIFSNTASSSPAQGVGVQISNANGVIVAGSNVSLGRVGTPAVNLGLTANYATTGGQVIAGNVQSIIGVTFIYQ